MARRPPFIAVLVAIAIVLVALLTAIVPHRTLILTVVTDRTAYGTGQPIPFYVRVIVGGNQPLNLSLSVCTIGFAVLSEFGETVYRVAPFQSPMRNRCGLTQMTLLRPGETRIVNFTWTPSADVPLGHWYTIRPEIALSAPIQLRIETAQVLLQ